MKRDNEEFEAYKKNLEKFDYYTKLTDEDRANYFKMSKKPLKFSLTLAKQHPFYWLYHVCGMKPRDYQFKMLDTMHKYGKVAGVTSRQIGKSVMVAGFAFWAAYNNKYPAGMDKKTTVLIVSHTEDAAKKLLQEVSNFVSMADERMAIYSQQSRFYTKEYFTEKMIKKPTQYKLEWSGGKIIVLPPTDKVRGNSASVLIIDEADFLKSDDPDYFFNSVALPTTTATSGKVFLWSTPKGTPSFFYNVIRPMNDEPLDGWHRIWYPWTIVDNNKMLDYVWTVRDQYIKKGDEMDFKCEYEASFLSGKHTYFAPELIDDAVDDDLREEYQSYGPVTLGLDFGDTHSRTVITVFKYNKERNEVTLLWYKEFKGGYNNGDIASFIDTLKPRYLIKEIVVDDCVGGKTSIELLRRRGYNLKLFQFKRDKHEYFEYLKVAFANKRIKMYRALDVIAQLKSIESHETHQGNIQIRKPNGGRDDIVDAFVMGCSPFIKPEQFRRRYIL